MFWQGFITGCIVGSISTLLIVLVMIRCILFDEDEDEDSQ